MRGTASGPSAWRAEGVAVLYIGLIAAVAKASGHAYVLFPELAALGHDVLKRPMGAWARAPVLLVATPLLTAVIGTLLARHLPFGLLAVMLDVGFAVFAIALLKSPIAPAISAGLLPLVLGVRSWWYPPSLLIGTGLLAGIAVLRTRFAPLSTAIPTRADRVDDEVERAPAQLSWLPVFVLFLAAAVLLSEVTGWRLVLFPPLVVIGFEAFAHAEVCPWAPRPLALMLACALTASAGLASMALLGAGALGAMCALLAGVIVLRVLDLHVPPALAVGLLPFVMPHPSLRYTAAVLLGTGLQTGVFLLWRRLCPRLIARTG
ncbi:MAG: HPP family protein [Steroidobacteraceae bacterium]